MAKGQEISRIKRISKFIYDREQKTVLGRTAKSWGLIFLFYLVAYAFLAAFFIGMISVFMYGYVTKDVPILTGMQSLLRLNPGVSFKPQISIATTFLQFTTFPSTINGPYLEEANRLFARYGDTNLTVPCPNGQTGVNFPDTPCRFPLSTLGPCSDPETSLKEGRPCIYLKLNKVFGWLPKLSNNSVFPNIALKCNGLNELADFQLQKPQYFPSMTTPDGETYGEISTVYFPFIRQPGYQPPLAAVRFPGLMRNTVVLVECKVYGLEGVDSTVSFEIVVDEPKLSA